MSLDRGKIVKLLLFDSVKCSFALKKFLRSIEIIMAKRHVARKGHIN